MNPQRNGQLICNVCRQDMSKDCGELIPHQESSTNLAPNETANQTAGSAETPVAELVQISIDDKQNSAESMASILQFLQSAEKEASANESGQKQSSFLPVFSPTLRDTEVEHISKQIAGYQALYEEAVEAALETVRSTLASMDAVHSFIMFATACDSERVFLSKSIQSMHLSIQQCFNGLNHPDLYSEYSETLAQMEANLTKERFALLHYRAALIDQQAAFDAMIKAADRKHETFDTVFRAFCEMEEAIKAKRLNKCLLD